MKFFDSAKQSMDVETMLINIMNEASVSKTITDAHKFKEVGENIYEIEITVTQIYPPL